MSDYRTDGPPEMRPVGETDFVAAAAAQSDASSAEGAVIAGIVGYADLTLGDAVESVLTAHVEAGGGRFRGIRHASGWDASPEVRNSHTDPPEGLYRQADFGAGLATLGRMGLSFDAWLYHPQLADLTELARAHPDVAIVLDHLGAPLGIGPYADRRDEVRELWRPAMEAIASCPNVSLKVGGIGMAIYGDGWHRRSQPPNSDDLVAVWGDDIRWCIDLFGPSRCMFESNFPVDKRGCSYTVLWNGFKKMSVGYSGSERTDLFAGAAGRFYRLDQEAEPRGEAVA
jgi:predicted TIM-barrel fold metal-dependent hydrolase